MTERLTRRIESGQADCAYCTQEYTPDRKGCSPRCELWEKQTEKLAHYEDLEEQGRLHIVPKKFWDRIMEHFIKDVCPSDYGLKGFSEADCKVNDGHCKECWEEALKGE